MNLIERLEDDELYVDAIDEAIDAIVKLRAMLKRLEWSWDNRFCPICGELREGGHRTSCKLAALLKEAAGD